MSASFVSHVDISLISLWWAWSNGRLSVSSDYERVHRGIRVCWSILMRHPCRLSKTIDDIFRGNRINCFDLTLQHLSKDCSGNRSWKASKVIAERANRHKLVAVPKWMQVLHRQPVSSVWSNYTVPIPLQNGGIRQDLRQNTPVWFYYYLSRYQMRRRQVAH